MVRLTVWPALPRVIGEDRAAVAGFPQAGRVVTADAGPQDGPSFGRMPTNVLIAGGGPAALEAALALHRFAGDRVATTEVLSLH